MYGMLEQPGDRLDGGTADPALLLLRTEQHRDHGGLLTARRILGHLLFGPGLVLRA